MNPSNVGSLGSELVSSDWDCLAPDETIQFLTASWKCVDVPGLDKHSKSCMMVERMPRHKDIIGSNLVGCWFIPSLPILLLLCLSAGNS